MILFNILIYVSRCTIVGIDLGSDSIKVAVGSRFKPVHLVRNLYSNEVTPNVFAYRDRSHWAFGEGALDQCKIYPDTCIQNQRVPLNDKLYFTGSPLKGYQIVALSLIQILQNVKNTENIVDDIKVVIAIPPSMTYREKSYLYSALTIAGINCIQFVTSTYAPIEVYVNEQKYGYRTDNTAVFIDIGHEGVRLSGFEFDNTRIVQKLCLYNDGIGGKTIDENLLSLIIKRHNLKLSNSKYNDTEYQKNRLVLLSGIRKAREQLTVNSKVTFEYKSKVITMTRKDIDVCCNEIKESLSQMINILREKHPKLLQSGSIQLLGGCSRIICLQEYINKLLPNTQLLKTMDSIASVCMGACYLIDSEIPSKIQVHDALVTTEIVLKTAGNVYKLFSYENTENFNPVVRLNNVDPLQLYQILDANNDDQEFTRFTINIPSNNYNSAYSNTVDIGFTLNYYLMPVPDQPMLIQQYDNQVSLSVAYERVGWEVSPEELSESKAILDLMITGINQRLMAESQMNLIEEYKLKTEKKVKSYGFLNWRKFAFTGICEFIESKYNTCLEQNNQVCPDEQIKMILYDFKSLVRFVLKIEDDDDTEKNNKKKTERNTEKSEAIDELNDLILACKMIGAKYDDIEKWMKSSLKSAPIREIYQYIGILKERGKKAQESMYSNL